MTSLNSFVQNVALGSHYVVHLPTSDDFDFWRERARSLVQCDVPPDRDAEQDPHAEVHHDDDVEDPHRPRARELPPHAAHRSSHVVSLRTAGARRRLRLL